MSGFFTSKQHVYMSQISHVCEETTTSILERHYARHFTSSVILVLRVYQEARGRDIVFDIHATSHERMKRENRVIKIFGFNLLSLFDDRG